jgi:opacity protein-like surface antigen
MKKLLVLLILFFAITASIHAADAAQSLGFIFEMRNLLLSIDSYDDGFQAGAGLKWWMMNTLALRGLLNFDLNIFEGNTTAEIGLGCGAELHPVKAKVSPYFGGFVGTRLVMDVENAVDFYFGGMAGVEMRVWENVGAFAEYDLLMRFDADGFTMGIGAGGGAQIGLIIYF